MSNVYQQLSMEERSVIFVGLRQGIGIRSMARMLARSPSTVSREIQRNAGRWGFRYRVGFAQHMTRLRRRHRPPVFVKRPDLWHWVIGRLQAGWSPQQISGRLKRMHPNDPDRQVSHETIYAAIYAQPHGYLRTALISALRQAGKKRRPRSQGRDRRGTWPDMTSIAERPEAVETRRTPGHWEGDLIIGKGQKSAVGTMVERMSRYVILAQVENRTAAIVRRGFTRQMRNVPPLLRKSITYDRGKEMAQHKRLEAALDLTVYFADPYAPWQRGTNENTNGLVRQYLPKGSDLSGHSQDDLNAIAENLNDRPRKCLEFQTPSEVFEQIILKAGHTNSNVALHS